MCKYLRPLFEVHIRTSDDGEEWTYTRNVVADDMIAAISFVRSEKDGQYLNIIKVIAKGGVEVVSYVC